MQRDRGLYSGGGGFMARFRIEATTLGGELLIRNAAATTAGEVEKPTTTGAADVMGVCMDSVAYSTSQANFDGFPGYRQSGEEGTVGIICDPFSVLQARVSGGSAPGTALGTVAPAVILTNTIADPTGLIITAAEVGTADMEGGLICGRTGNNAGVVKRQTDHINNTSANVTEPFPRTIAVGDTFFRVPFSKSCTAVQLTASVFTEVDGTIAYGTGAPFRVTEVHFDIIEDEIALYMLAGDHFYNPSA